VNNIAATSVRAWEFNLLPGEPEATIAPLDLQHAASLSSPLDVSER
jgi:hypothetical protein